MINNDTPKVDTYLGARWWNEPPERVAASLLARASAIELRQWHRRHLNLTCTRHITGRELSSVYGYAMARRPSYAAAYARSTFTAPEYNAIEICADTYMARIFKGRPFIQVSPQAGNFKARLRARRLSRWVDGMFYGLRFWSDAELCGLDGITTGNGFYKVSEGLDGEIAGTRVLEDELLVDAEEGAYGRIFSLIHRVFLHKEELLARFGDDPDAKRAIEKAPGVFSGLYSAGDNNDIVPLCEGYRLPFADGKPGRRVLAVNNYALEDKPWKRPRFPFAHFRFKLLPVGWLGKGLAEMLLPTQRGINRQMAAIDECHDRMAWPRVQRDRAANISTASLVGRAGGIVDYTGTPARFETPQAVNDEMYRYLETRKANAKQIARISEQAATGQKTPGLNSGLALMTQSQIDDAAHADVGQRWEDFVTDVFELIRDEAEELKPAVTVPGRKVLQLKWDEVRIDSDNYLGRAFPISRLSQVPAFRQQQIADWYADGQINKNDKMRLEMMPDTEGFANLATAARDDIEFTLDEMIETGRYMPPEPYQDLTTALQVAQSRYLQERHEETPADRLHLLQLWIAKVEEMIGGPEAPGGAGAPSSPAPAPSPLGIQPPSGMPAPPPPQVTPSIGPPAALPAA